MDGRLRVNVEWHRGVLHFEKASGRKGYTRHDISSFFHGDVCPGHIPDYIWRHDPVVGGKTIECAAIFVFQTVLSTAALLLLPTIKHKMYENMEGYCYMRAFATPPDLGKFPLLIKVLDAYRDTVPDNRRPAFVTKVGTLFHVSNQSLNARSRSFNDNFTSQELLTPVGGTGATWWVCALTALATVDLLMRTALENAVGYCYLSLTRFPFIWLVGRWPSAWWLSVFVNCEEDYDLTWIKGAFHIEKGGNYSCYMVRDALWGHPDWLVGGFHLTEGAIWFTLLMAWLRVLIAVVLLGVMCHIFFEKRTVEEWIEKLSTAITHVLERMSKAEADARYYHRWWSFSDLFGSISAARIDMSLGLIHFCQVYLQMAGTLVLWWIMGFDHVSVPLGLSCMAFTFQHYGVFVLPEIAFFTCGTTGDDVPLERLVERLKSLGFPSCIIKLLDPGYAKSKLNELEKGAGMPAADSLAKGLEKYHSCKFEYPGLHILPWTLRTGRKTLTFDLAPVAYNRGPFRVANDTNPLFCFVNALVNVASASEPNFRFGDFIWCSPRLKRDYRVYNTEPTGKALVSTGSSSIAITGVILDRIVKEAGDLTIETDNPEVAAAHGWELIRSTQNPTGNPVLDFDIRNHDKLFQYYDLVFCHGGAGTMQTIMAARPENPVRAVSLSLNLDRQWANKPIMFRESENHFIVSLCSACGPRMWFAVAWSLLRQGDLEFLRLLWVITQSLFINIYVPAKLLEDALDGGLIAHLFARVFWDDIARVWPLLLIAGFCAHNVLARMAPEASVLATATAAGTVVWYTIRLLEPKRLVASMLIGPLTTIVTEISLDFADWWCPLWNVLMFTTISKLSFLYAYEPGKTYIGLQCPVFKNFLIPIPCRLCFFDEETFIFVQGTTLTKAAADESQWMRRDLAVPVPFEVTMDQIWKGYEHYMGLAYGELVDLVYRSVMEFLDFALHDTKVVFTIFGGIVGALAFVSGSFIHCLAAGFSAFLGFWVFWGCVGATCALYAFIIRALLVLRMVYEKTNHVKEDVLVSLEHNCSRLLQDLSTAVHERLTYDGRWTQWSPHVAASDAKFSARRKVNALIARGRMLKQSVVTITRPTYYKIFPTRDMVVAQSLESVGLPGFLRLDDQLAVKGMSDDILEVVAPFVKRLARVWMRGPQNDVKFLPPARKARFKVKVETVVDDEEIPVVKPTPSIEMNVRDYRALIGDHSLVEWPLEPYWGLRKDKKTLASISVTVSSMKSKSRYGRKKRSHRERMERKKKRDYAKYQMLNPLYEFTPIFNNGEKTAVMVSKKKKAISNRPHIVFENRDRLNAFEAKVLAQQAEEEITWDQWKNMGISVLWALKAVQPVKVRVKTQWAPDCSVNPPPKLYNGRLDLIVASRCKWDPAPFKTVFDERIALLEQFKNPASLEFKKRDQLVRHITRKTTIRNYADIVGQDAVDEGADGCAFATKSTMLSSLREYAVPNPKLLPRERVKEIAQAIYDQDPEKFANAELASPVKLARDFIKKKKMSPGIDFAYLGLKSRQDIRRGGFFKSLIKAGMEPYRTGVFRPALFHAFPKSQIVARSKLENDPDKLRSVTAASGPDNITQGVCCYDLNKRKPDLECWSKAGVPSTGYFFNKIFVAMSGFNYIYSLDIRAFDRNLNDSLIQIGTEVQRLAFANHPDFEMISGWLDHLELNKRYGYIVNLVNDELDEIRGDLEAKDRESWDKVPDVAKERIKEWAQKLYNFDQRFPGGYLVKVGGGATGDFNVTFTNTIACQAFVVDSLCYMLNIPPSKFKDHFSFANVSDDNMLGSRVPIDVETLKKVVQDRHGLDLKIESKGTSIYDQVFLAKHPVDSNVYAQEFKDAGIEQPRFAIVHDKERLNRSIAQVKKADERKKKLSTAAQRRWEIERLCGLMYNCAHHKELFGQLHSEALTILRTGLRSEQRKGLHIPSYNTMLKKFYSAKREDDFKKVKRVQIDYPPETLVYDHVYVHARMLARQAQAATIGDLGEFPEYRVPHSESTPGFFEPFMWLCFRRNYGTSPTSAELSSLCSRSAFSAFCNAEQWMETHGDKFAKLDDVERQRLLHHQTWVMLIYTALYHQVDYCVGLLNRNDYTRVVMFLVQIYRYDLPRLFAAGSHLHFLGRGEPSTGLSNLMPKDRHHYIKKITLLVARLVPVPYALGNAPISYFTRLAADAIDGLGRMPTISITTDVKMDTSGPGTVWEEAATKINSLVKAGNKTICLTSPCGAGKTRYLPEALLAPTLDAEDKQWQRVMVVMPRRILCEQYLVRKAGTIWKKGGESRLTSHMTCTYGYIGHAINNGAPAWFNDTLFVFDEAHERSVDWSYVFRKMQGKITALLMTATPLRWMIGYPLVDVPATAPHRVTILPDLNRRPDEQNMLNVFQDYMGTCKHILMIHPAETACKRMVKELLKLGVEVRLLSANQRILPKEGHVVATSVADSSLTFDGCDMVIDSGLSIVNQSGLPETVTYDKATRIQRVGRTGRTVDGRYLSFQAASTREYEVCPSLDQILVKSHYLEYFPTTVALDENPRPSSPNVYLHFSNDGTELEMASAELYLFAEQANLGRDKSSYDTFTGCVRDDVFLRHWIEARGVSTILPFKEAQQCFMILKPFYKYGEMRSTFLDYKNKLVSLHVEASQCRT
jgi:hypothetical protein